MYFIYWIIFLAIDNIAYATLNQAESALIDAIENNDIKNTQALIEVGKIPYRNFLKQNKIASIDNLDFYTAKKDTPLTLAIKNNCPEIVKILLKAHANPNLTNKYLPISMALESENYEIANMILKNEDFNINFLDKEQNSVFTYLINNKKWPPLNYLYNYYFCKENKFFNINGNMFTDSLCGIYFKSRNNEDIKDAWIAQMRALFFWEKYQYNKKNIIRFIIEKDFIEALLEYKKIYEENYLLDKNNDKILFKNYCENIRFKNNADLIHYAVSHNAIKILKYLLKDLQILPDSVCNANKRTAFFKAVMEKKYNLAFILFTSGASLKKKDKYYKNIKFTCASEPNSLQFLSLLKQILKIKSDKEIETILQFINQESWSIDKNQTWLNLELKKMIMDHLKKIKKNLYLTNFAHEQTNEYFSTQCLICEDEHNIGYIVGPALCNCFICSECTKIFINTGLQDARVKDFRCPNNKCNRQVNIEYLKKNNITNEQIERYYLHLYLKRSKDTLHCPSADCIGGIELAKDSYEANTYLSYECKYCEFSGCINCQSEHHTGKCDQIINNNQYNELQELLKKKAIKLCPKCQVAIQKNEGCERMKCFQCSASFYWYNI